MSQKTTPAKTETEAEKTNEKMGGASTVGENSLHLSIEEEIEQSYRQRGLCILNQIIPKVETHDNGKRYAIINIPWLKEQILNQDGEFDESSGWFLMGALKSLSYFDDWDAETDERIDALWYLRYLYLYDGVKPISPTLRIPDPDEEKEG